jgi:hypothetical protein
MPVEMACTRFHMVAYLTADVQKKWGRDASPVMDVEPGNYTSPPR